MSFKVAVSKNFPGLVTAEMPGPSGKPIKVSFHVLFKRLTTTEFDDLVTRMNTLDEQGKRTVLDQDIIDLTLDGFTDDLLDDNNNPLEYTPANVAMVCDIHPMRARIAQSFFDAYTNAKAKN
jgi:hypothetical protein